MRVCFDRLCFSNRRPANNKKSNNENDDQKRRTNANLSTTGVQVNQCNADLSSASHTATISSRATTILPPDQVEFDKAADDPDNPQSAPEIQIIASASNTQNYSSDCAIIFTPEQESQLNLQSSVGNNISIVNQITKPLETGKPKENADDHKNYVTVNDAHVQFSCTSTTVTASSITSPSVTQRTTMQHDPNANIQFQPDLGLVNSNLPIAYSGPAATTNITLDNNPNNIQLATLPLQTSNDVLTHTLIYGTVPSSVQQLHTDPDVQTRNILQQQEIQLQHRFQQLQQLQAQTQGLFASPSQVTLPAPIVIQQPTAGVAPTTHTIYTGSPTDFCSQQKILTTQMQTLCLSSATGNRATATSVPMSPTVFEATPTVSGVNFLNNSYVPATAQEERLIQMLQAKDLKIQEMQRALQYKDTEIAELKSHLDKFQSVFPFSRSGATTPSGFFGSIPPSGATAAIAGASGIGGERSDYMHKAGPSFQRQRAQGISAEPQNESSVLLDKVAFPKYDKDEK